MAEYDIAFARKFADVAQATVARGLRDVEDHRVVAYISRVSMELALKALLEQAGVPVSKIRSHWHRLKDLLAEVDKCEVKEEIGLNLWQWVPASRLRAVTVFVNGIPVPVGMVLEAQDHGASVYPNELRYGAVPKDFPAEALAASAEAIGEWVSCRWNSIRRRGGDA